MRDHVPKTEVVPGENDLVPGTGPPIGQVEAPCGLRANLS